MKKYLLISGAAALCLIGVMFVVQADNNAVLMNNNRHNNHQPRHHRGPVIATIDGAKDVASGVGHAFGHGLKNVFSGGRHHRGYYDSRGNYHK